MTYWKAWSINPPLQPSLPWAVEQSTRFCSERETKVFPLRNQAPSIEPVAENDLNTRKKYEIREIKRIKKNYQQDPHCPWFLIPVTAPLVLQSQLVGTALFFKVYLGERETGFLVMLRPLNLALNSALVRSENSLWPTVNPLLDGNSEINLWLALKISNLMSCSAWVA